MKWFILSTALLVAFSAATAPVYTASNEAAASNTNNYLGSFYDQDDTAAQRAKNIQPPNPIWTVIKVILYLGVFGVAGYFIVKFVIAKSSAVPSSEDVNVVEVVLTKQVGMGSYLQIVKVGPSYYLLSLSGEGSRFIDKITDKETLDFIELNKDKIKPKETKFFDFLTYLPLNKKGGKMDFLKSQKDKLKKM